MQSAAPSCPIERGLPGSGLLAHVLVSKLPDHLPLYRQSEIFARDVVELPRVLLTGLSWKRLEHMVHGPTSRRAA